MLTLEVARNLAGPPVVVAAGEFDSVLLTVSTVWGGALVPMSGGESGRRGCEVSKMGGRGRREWKDVRIEVRRVLRLEAFSMIALIKCQFRERGI